MDPMIPAFNNACNLIASKIFPLGFDMRHAAPNTYRDLCRALNEFGRMEIWDGDREQTCFAHTETWRAFRAWHDWCHYRFDGHFTLLGEHKVLHIQAGQLMRLYGRADDVRDWIALMFCNILGPLEDALVEPVTLNGRQYCEANWQKWKPYADNIIAHQGQTDVDAIDFAEKAYEYRDKFGPAVPPQADHRVTNA